MPFKDSKTRNEYLKGYRAEHREQLRKNQEDWVARNPEHAKEVRKAISKRYYAKHAEERKEYSSQYRDENSDKVKMVTAKWFSENVEYRRKYKAEYRRTHKKEIAEYRKSHPENHKAYKQNRRTRQSGAGGSFTADEWKSLCKKYKNLCLCCGKHKKLTADHVIPVSKGGSSNIENIQPLCGPCNSRKHNGTTDFR